jgi:hypothetical protein
MRSHLSRSVASLLKIPGKMLPSRATSSYGYLLFIYLYHSTIGTRSEHAHRVQLVWNKNLKKSVYLSTTW